MTTEETDLNPRGGTHPLLPVFGKGEMVTIQRSVNGENVLYFVEAEEGCSIGLGRVTLSGLLRKYGKSPYADGRVENQRQAIQRLLDQRERVIALAREIERTGDIHGATQILALLLEPEPEAEKQ